jgi:chaperonin cofactor prefoldin
LGQEFEKMDEEETIYKLVGPVLLKQEKIEAESTVMGRLDFIGGEMYAMVHPQPFYLRKQRKETG